jgi:lysine 2,3-aminomutase
MAVPHFVIDAPGGGGKIPLLPGDYLVHLDEDGAILRNYENKSFHYPQPTADGKRELPMVGARSSREDLSEAFAACGDSYPDRDGFASWGNSCGGDTDDL